MLDAWINYTFIAGCIWVMLYGMWMLGYALINIYVDSWLDATSNRQSAFEMLQRSQYVSGIAGGASLFYMLWLEVHPYPRRIMYGIITFRGIRVLFDD